MGFLALVGQRMEPLRVKRMWKLRMLREISLSHQLNSFHPLTKQTAGLFGPAGLSFRDYTIAANKNGRSQFGFAR